MYCLRLNLECEIEFQTEGTTIKKFKNEEIYEKKNNKERKRNKVKIDKFQFDNDHDNGKRVRVYKKE